MTAKGDDEGVEEGRTREPDDDAKAEPDDDAKAKAEPDDDAKAEPHDDAKAEPHAAAGEPDLPAFAKGWPHDAALHALLEAFAKGNYAHVRAEAPKLAEQTKDPAVRAAAKDLRRRIDPDPVSSILLLLAVALLVVLASHYLGHRPDKPAGPTNEKPPPPQPTSP
jgi:hypothetical protein